jgi:hypothetical protein
VAVLPEGLRREELRLQAERRVPPRERRSVQAESPCPEHPEAARLGVPAGPHRACPAYPSAAVAPMAVALLLAAWPQVVRLPAELRSEPEERGVPAAPRREAQRVSAAQPQAALAASGAGVAGARGAERDAAAEPRQVAGSGAAVRLPAEAVERDAAVRPPEEAVERAVAAAERRPGAVRPAAPDAEGLQREVPDAPAARPSAVAWAAPPCLQAARPAPSPRVRSAHASKDLRIAQP